MTDDSDDQGRKEYCHCEMRAGVYNNVCGVCLMPIELHESDAPAREMPSMELIAYKMLLAERDAIAKELEQANACAEGSALLLQTRNDELAAAKTRIAEENQKRNEAVETSSHFEALSRRQLTELASAKQEIERLTYDLKLVPIWRDRANQAQQRIKELEAELRSKK